MHPGVSGIVTDVMLFYDHGRQLVHRYRIYRDPLPYVSLRGAVIRKLTAFANRAMTVARLTSLHLSIPTSGTASTPDRLDSALVALAPMRKPKSTTAAVSFATD